MPAFQPYLRGAHTLLYAGAITNACGLLSTATGFDLGYRQYLLSDCTAALTEEDQQAAEPFIDTYLAQLISAESAVKGMRSATAVGS